jgi:transposase
VKDLTRVFVDTSKQVFQLHGVNSRDEVVLRRKLSRSQFLDFFAGLEPTLIGLEACGSSHYWARRLGALGHEVRLIAPQHVKPYVRRGKNDAADAEGGCEALGRPRTRFVPVKDPQAQAGLMLVSVREALIRRRTQLANAIRGHAAEFGVVAAKGLDKIAPLLERVAEEESVPQLAKTLFASMAEAWAALGEQVKAVEKTFMAWHRNNALSRRLATIPAVGPVGACLLVIKAPDPMPSSPAGTSAPGSG